MVIMVNKWDLIEKTSKTADNIRKSMLESLAPIDYVPIIFASALEKQRIFQVVEKAVEVYQNKIKKVKVKKGCRCNKSGQRWLSIALTVAATTPRTARVGTCSSMEGKYRFRMGAAEPTDRPVPRTKTRRSNSWAGR